MQKRLLQTLLQILRLTPLEMANYARVHTQFYQNFYSSRQIKDFDLLPILTKRDLPLLNPYALLSREYQKKVILFGETSGSSGSPTPAFFTRTELNGLLALSYLSPFTPLVKQALQSNRTAVNGLTFGYTLAGYSFGLLLQKAGALVANLGSRSTIALPERTARTISILKPAVISATPLDFMAWMEIIRTDHPSAFAPVLNQLAFLLSTAEPCADARRVQLEAHFGIKHINTYATVDGFITIPCPCGQKHLIDPLYQIELYDQHLHFSGKEGKGRLSFTNLMKKSTPMVKFLLDDLVTIKKSICPYGFAWDIIPHGRYELSIDLDGKVWGNIDFEEIIYQYGLFMDYRLQIKDKKVLLFLEEYPGAQGSYDLTGLKERLQTLTDCVCELNLQPLGSLTDYRKVRLAKSVIKIIDQRSINRQELPAII